MIKLLDLLQEGKKDAIIKFVDTDKISNGNFNELLKIDTTKTFKYIELICYLYYELEISTQELTEVFGVAIENLESKKVRYEIQKIKTEKDYDDFKSKVLDVKYVNSDLQQYRNMEGAEVVYEDKRVTVVCIKTTKASISLGRGTTWCISRTGKNEFTNYIKNKYVIYFVFDNTKPNNSNLSKLCVVIDEKENFIEIKSKNQTYNGKEEKEKDYPKSYLTDELGLNLNIFKWLYVSPYQYIDGLTEETARSKFPWFFDDDVLVEDAIIGHKGNILILYSGDWYGGTWDGGIFRGGYFGPSPDDEDGIVPVWVSGKYEGGEFEGIWKDPTNLKPLNVKQYRDGLTYEIIEEKFPWLLNQDVVIGGAVLGYSGDTLIWYSGGWAEGVWEDGIWKGGQFWKDGIWKGGIFEDGYFAGEWYGGEWKGWKFEGEWLDPNNPKPINVKEYRDGLTYEIIKDKFSWLLEGDVKIDDNVTLGYDKSTKKLIWYDGRWNKGIWEDGIWKNGGFREDGIWKGGIFEDGYFYGKWYGGEWKAKEFRGEWLDSNNSKPLNVKEYKDGLTYEIIKDKFSWLLEDDVKIKNADLGYDGNKLIWYSGNWQEGVWKGGIWKDGWFYGKWKGGIFEDGYFYGKWYGGKWKGGEFSKFAEWLDPNNPDPRNT